MRQYTNRQEALRYYHVYSPVSSSESVPPFQPLDCPYCLEPSCIAASPQVRLDCLKMQTLGCNARSASLTSPARVSTEKGARASIFSSIVNFGIVSAYAILRPSLGVIFEPLTRGASPNALIFWKLWFAHYFTVFTFLLYLVSVVLFSINLYVSDAYRRHLRSFLVTALVAHIGSATAVDSLVTLSRHMLLSSGHVWSLWTIRPVGDALFATTVATVTCLACYSRKAVFDMDFETRVVGSLLTSLVLAHMSLIPIDVANLQTDYDLILLAIKGFNAVVVVGTFTRVLMCSSEISDCNQIMYNNLIFFNGVLTLATRDLMLCNQ